MKKIALIGTELIHTYPYVSYFNGYDPEKLRQNAKRWMLEFLEGTPSYSQSDGCRITHVWSEDREVIEKLADTCFIEKVVNKTVGLPEEVDGAMVMDRNASLRAQLIKPFLAAGKPVFVDKILSEDPGEVRVLIELARQSNTCVASWSQLRFAKEIEELAGQRGGTALCTYRLPPNRLAEYCIHLISFVQGAFGSGIESIQIIEQNSFMSLRYQDGTIVILRISEEMPEGWQMSYMGRDGTMIIRPLDSYSMFHTAARYVDRMFVQNEQPIDFLEMIEAANLIKLFMESRKAGSIVKI